MCWTLEVGGDYRHSQASRRMLSGVTPAYQGTPRHSVLRVENLSVDFIRGGLGLHAVRQLSYEIGVGEAVALVGESGSGKTVSALAVLRLLPSRTARVSATSIDFDGNDLTRLADSELRKLRGYRVSMVFQDPLSSLNPLMTIGQQISEVLTTHLGLSDSQAAVRTQQLLDMVGIAGHSRRMRSYPHEFSGGMRQRVMIAMALACRPALLIADEPTTALDVTVQAQIMELLANLRKEFGMAVLLITHDIGIVAGFADRTLVMYSGRLVESGPTENVLAHPRHPYTLGLLRSITRVDRNRRGELPSIRGMPPNPYDAIPGCAFAPRCAWAIPQCHVSSPALEAVGTDWAAACWVKPNEAV